ncbi:glycosyl transferase [Candidatus Pacearchaeota archaeon CG10_big_fil_rev_8_21_14_0_10_35_13]|nr:MAG: glycosyl transferase [Candidatus Pacearchaeota archaeon CG10_big_fil_rev_8_21_14_0_10_35_13]
MVKKKLLLSVIMPAYNEINTIRKIIDKVKSVNIPKEIIIVDDGSTDGTKEFLQGLNDPSIKFFHYSGNVGKSYAVRTGISHATGDIIIIQDADLEYDPNDYHKLLEPIISGKSKVVYGTRFPNNASRPPLTNKFFLGNRLLTLLSNILYNAQITDEPTCYKVFDSKVLKSLNLKSKRFEFCPEVTAKVRKKGHKIFEVPISYNPRSVDEGKKINWRDGVQAVWTLIKYRFVD